MSSVITKTTLGRVSRVPPRDTGASSAGTGSRSVPDATGTTVGAGSEERARPAAAEETTRAAASTAVPLRIHACMVSLGRPDTSAPE